MFAKWLLGLLLPLALATTLGACENQGVQPGVVQNASGYRGETGRVVSIREVPLRGQRGMSNGTMVGGGLGAAGGAAIGAATTNSVGGAVVGGLLGAVAGGIAGTAVDQNSGSRRGIEVTVRKDDGSRVTIAQPDDGDVQMGDRVVIVYDRNGVAKAVRDGSYRRD